MGKLTLNVDAKKHPNAVTQDDPSEVREVGFEVTTTLISDIPAVSTLQEKYKLEQWVTDRYWLETRDSDTSEDWHTEKEEKTKWERDEFGEDEDAGEWNSTKTKTTFEDEPGFLGKIGKNARALTKRQRLGDYEISFKWKVYNGSEPLLETEVITLKAEPNDDGDITYTKPINKTWEINVG